MNIGKIPRLFRGAIYPSVQSGAGIYSIDINEVSVTTPEATLMSLSIPVVLFNKDGVSIDVESYLDLASGHTLYWDCAGNTTTETIGGVTSFRHIATITKRPSDYLLCYKRDFQTYSTVGYTTFTVSGSTLNLAWRGTNVTQKLMRTKVYPV